MASLLFSCPFCSKETSINSEDLGKAVTCGSCRTGFVPTTISSPIVSKPDFEANWFIPMVVVSGIAALIGAAIFISAKSAIHEILATLFFVISAMFFCTREILCQLDRNLKKP